MSGVEEMVVTIDLGYVVNRHHVSLRQGATETQRANSDPAERKLIVALLPKPSPGGDSSRMRSIAIVVTDAPERYAKQLLAHLGRKNTVETVAGDRQGGRLVFAYGTGTVRPEDNRLVLEAVAEDVESLAHVEDVLGRHLERFGAKRELVVTWQRGGPEGNGG